MVVASIRLLPSPFLAFAPRRSPYSWRPRPSSVTAFSSVHSTASKGDGGVELGGDQRQAEVVFLGTGTSEGVPRFSCLTNPLNECVFKSCPTG
ncbi:uncharacterized protein LOC124838587 isoform X2 [Vigna umbellata]|uniref:uncharacterized protein LOC124838587 isoform X2 n=1 Tax=Vigna umbellata TaxID=87088 RepID=UPI001F5FC39D|nr:uncharacterized protein LOC124838587 isoform X2 [Vigna umbellata]